MPHFWPSAEKAKSKESNWHLKLTHQFKRLVALRDFFHRQAAQAFETEFLYAEAGEHTAVNHRFTQIVEVHLFHCAREIAGHAAGECVPCSGRVVNVFQWIRATAEELVFFAKEQRAMLPFFNCNILRPHLPDATPRFDEACFLRHFARFAI